MRTVRYFTVLGLAVLAAAGCARQEGFKREYRLTLNVPSSFYWGMGATRFAELVGKKTGGRINVKPYYSSTLLKGAQMRSTQMVAKGVIDCAFESTINMSSVIPEMNLFSLPFFINTFANLDAIENGAAGKALFAAMEAKGLTGLAWGENGFRQLTNGRKDVTSPGDLDGMRVRVVGSPLFIDIFKALGADPVNMNWGDAVTAFQQGVVDGQENPVGVLVPVQIHQYHKHITFWNYLADPLVLYWNKKQWDAFPDDVRTAIREAAAEAVAYQKALARAGLDDGAALTYLDENGDSIDVAAPKSFLAGKGMTVTELDGAQYNAFRTATEKVYMDWVPKIGTDLVELARRDMAGSNKTTGRLQPPRSNRSGQRGGFSPSQDKPAGYNK